MNQYQCPNCLEPFELLRTSPDGHYDHKCSLCGELLQWDDAPFSDDPHRCAHGLRLRTGSKIPVVRK
jgi:5-methylcytosine-specific restriction endonuclease McrA